MSWDGRPARALDFTPVLCRADTGATLAGTTGAYGWYVQDGDVITVHGEATFGTASTGGAAITLPFPSTIRQFSIGVCALWGTSTPADQSGQAYMVSSKDRLVVAAFTGGFRDASVGHAIRYSAIYRLS